MRQHKSEPQIEQLLRDDYCAEQIAHQTGLPTEQILQIINQRKQQKSKASTQHNQAIYAMSL